MNQSPQKSAARGNRKAFEVRPNFAPLKMARAPKGVKFQGCGRIRTTAAKRIKQRMITARKTIRELAEFILRNTGVLLLQRAADRKKQKCETRHSRRRDRRQVGAG